MVATDNPNPEPIENPEPEQKTFTQDEVNQLIQNRLKQEREARAKEDAERRKKADLEKLDGEQRLKAEHEQALKELNESLTNAKREAANLKVGKMLAEKGYDSEFASLLIGVDDDESKANVERFDKMIAKLVEAKVKTSLASGAPRIPGGGSPDNDLRAQLRTAAGLR